MDRATKRYWKRLRDRGRAWLPDEGTVREAIQAAGYWEEHYEWRISTVTDVRIEPAHKWGLSVYQVIVNTDQEDRCWCPGLAEALSWAGVFWASHQDAFYSLGWPSSGLTPTLGSGPGG